MKYFIFLCLFLIAGCASNEEKSEPKQFSDDTNRAFEMIERGGSYYLKKAPKDSTPAPQIQKIHTPQQRQQVTQEEMKTEPIHHNKTKNAKVDERLIEINQNLAFYCMKHRKDVAFNGDESKCMGFVNYAMTECQKIHHIVNSKLLKCIQARLKNRQ